MVVLQVSYLFLREATIKTSNMERFKVLLFILRSLTFNSATSRATVVDTIFEPVFWIVDHFVRILGPVSNSSVTQVT